MASRPEARSVRSSSAPTGRPCRGSARTLPLRRRSSAARHSTPARGSTCCGAGRRRRDDDPLHRGSPIRPTRAAPGWLGRDERVLDRSLRGPLTGVEAGLNDFSLPAPALSADGTKMAYVATGELRPPPTSFVNPGFDVFYVDLGSAAYRAGGLRASTIELTRAGNNADSRAMSPIDTVSMTRDGHYLGITSSRVVSPGTALTPLGHVPAELRRGGGVRDRHGGADDRSRRDERQRRRRRRVDPWPALAVRGRRAGLVRLGRRQPHLRRCQRCRGRIRRPPHAGQPQAPAENDDPDDNVHHHEPTSAARHLGERQTPQTTPR